MVRGRTTARAIPGWNAIAIHGNGRTRVMTDVAAARWGIAFHSYSNNPNVRSRKWYRVSRLVYADGGWFELYWHPDVNLRGDNLKDIQRKARDHSLNLIPGLFCDKRSATTRGSEMERII
jgi:hypothetical protein